eukprot:TRINITY_DN1974_c0_g2_i1.p1 TRINITY_DN1974_c0_g2~~TRINITY_DN1974_c0_g2_i1.p1  ORF type:complete len:609 (-),score=206.71 TRINITY_DN1974_c0_g2_i1:584-2410(-)
MALFCFPISILSSFDFCFSFVNSPSTLPTCHNDAMAIPASKTLVELPFTKSTIPSISVSSLLWMRPITAQPLFPILILMSTNDSESDSMSVDSTASDMSESSNEVIISNDDSLDEEQEEDTVTSKQITKEDQEAAAGFKKTANKYFGAKDYEEAEKYYTQAIETDPTVAVYYGNRAFTYIKLEQYGGALADAEMALKLDPDYIKGYYRIGAANMALGHYKEAKEAFAKVLKVKPKDKDARTNYKAAKEAHQQQLFAEAIALDDDDASSGSSSSVFSETKIDSMDIPEEYDQARIEDNTITKEYVEKMMEEFSEQKLIHTKYVYLILAQAKELLTSMPPLNRVSLPESDKFTVCGDVHGQFYDLLHIFEINGLPSEDNPYLFNGDFVDRGSFSCEVILTLLAWKLVYPDSFHLHRGNHETINMNKMYGFEGEVKAKYGQKAMSMFTEVFQALPLCSVIQDKVFVCHGGLFSEDGVTLTDLESIDRFREPPERGPMCDMLWSDPAMYRGRSPSKRGVGVAFGPDITAQFLKENNLELVVRSHEVKPQGYEVMHDGKCITIFSAPNYCDQIGNLGAYIVFDHTMQPQFKTFACVPHPNVRAMAYASPFMGF